MTNRKDDKSEITIECLQPNRNMDLYFRTADMLAPELFYDETADGKEVACSISLVPTFEPVAPQDAFEVVKDEKPDAIKFSDGSDFHFISIVDRSGSMNLRSRMEIARQSLFLFMRSLPENASSPLSASARDFRLSSKVKCSIIRTRVGMQRSQRLKIHIQFWRDPDLGATSGGTTELPIRQTQTNFPTNRWSGY